MPDSIYSRPDAAKREATAIGTSRYQRFGKGSTYNYVFKIDGVQLQGQSSSCHTPLASQTCYVGAKVLVYYVRTPALETRLQEFGDAGPMLLTCVCLNVGGLLLIVMYFMLNRKGSDSGESEDADESGPSEEPGELHIVPRG